MIPDPSPPFTVEMSGSARDQLAAALRRAAELQVSAEVIPVLTDVSERLRTDPRGWGDPLRDLRHLHLTFYRGILHPFIVYFSVHQRIPLVSVWHFKVQPGHPLVPPGNGE
jgi:hypothetical protein